MTHIALNGTPHLHNRQLLPHLGNIDLQREVARISKVNGLVKTSTESLPIRPNHYEFHDEHSRMQGNRGIREYVCCEGRCDMHCPHKRNTKESYYPSEGNTQKCNSKASKILGGLPMSLGQVQHKQIRHQWP